MLRRSVEEIGPVDGELLRHGAKTQQAGKHRDGRRLGIHLIVVPDLAVTISIRSVSELDGNIRFRLGVIVSASVGEEVIHEFSTDEQRQEFMDNQPLVGPLKFAAGSLEIIVKLLDEPVVSMEHADMKLVDDELAVVTRVGHKRSAFRVTRYVVPSGSQQKPRRVIPLVEEGVAAWPVAIETLEIRKRRSHITQALDLGFHFEGGPVGRDVVRNELAEKGPSCRNARIVLAARTERGPVAGAVPDSDGKENVTVAAPIASQLGEEPAVGAGPKCQGIAPRFLVRHSSRSNRTCLPVRATLSDGVGCSQ